MPLHRYVLVVLYSAITIFRLVPVPGLKDNSLSIALWIDLVSLNLRCLSYLLLAHLFYLSVFGLSFFNRIALKFPTFLILYCFLRPFILLILCRLFI